MEAQFEKQKGKIVLLVVWRGSNRENIEEEEDRTMELQGKLKHLDLELKHGIEELRKTIAPVASVGSFGNDQVATMEEDIVEQQMG
jgi:hypothetical protein